MTKNLKKKVLSFAVLFALAFSVVGLVGMAPANAQPDLGLNYVGNTGLGNSDPRNVAASIINIAMTILGLIAVVIILLGGFKWMTAGGSDDKVSEAKKLLGQGVIGLLIILAAWGIATFVIGSLLNATGATPAS
ncbi:MAG: pilin [Candidatus Pacebacteria bacterium]|nr:pilin [Candidatus Paceibacterota bacterium]